MAVLKKIVIAKKGAKLNTLLPSRSVIGCRRDGIAPRIRARAWQDDRVWLEVRQHQQVIQGKLKKKTVLGLPKDFIAVQPRARSQLKAAIQRMFVYPLPKRASAWLAELAIDPNYAVQRGLRPTWEARSLVDVGPDRFNRPLWLTPVVASAWLRVQAAAKATGVEMDAVSGFRGFGYQAGIVIRKRKRGESWAEIFSVSSAPGFSEHHGGHAIDLASGKGEALSEAFAETAAFSWLSSRAPAYGWKMSFPANNRHGVCYEPWHWCYRRKHRQRARL